MKEEISFQKWITFLFWTGIAIFILKEVKHTSWEDFVALWSVVGLIGYFIFSRFFNTKIRKISIFAIIVYYLISISIFFILLMRFINGLSEKSPFPFVGKELDWASLVFAIVLVVIAVAKQFLYPIR
jgi:hypothetical protein